MALRYIFGTAPYEQPMTEKEIKKELDQERLFHKLNWRKGSSLGMCSCGYAFQNVTSKQNALWRFDHHVQLCVDLHRDQLEGRSYYGD